jgi:hypothetical protein
MDGMEISWVYERAGGGNARMPARRESANGVGAPPRKTLRCAPYGHATKNMEKFMTGAGTDNTLRASFWTQFSHWNNSKHDKTYCIRSF